MRFIITKDELKSQVSHTRKRDFIVNASTSVIRQKTHFLESLGSLGEIISLGQNPSRDELTDLFKNPDVIFALIHGGSHAEDQARIKDRGDHLRGARHRRAGRRGGQERNGDALPQHR